VHGSFESGTERAFGLVTEGGRNRRDALVAALQAIRRHQPAPVRQIAHRRHADQDLETLRKNRQGYAGDTRQFIQRPVTRRLGVNGANRRAPIRRSDRRELPGLRVGRQGRQLKPQHLHKHEVQQMVRHQCAAWLWSAQFGRQQIERQRRIFAWHEQCQGVASLPAQM
jgi:hypothetical protein